MQSEYAQSGVDYRLIHGFKEAMVEMGKRTHQFPNTRSVVIGKGGVYEYIGTLSHQWKQVTEGLGNKNWIASWMERNAGTGLSYHHGIGIDTIRMATNDLLTFRALPVTYTDEVAAGLDRWYSERPQRAADLVESYYRGCLEDGMALTQGESPALKFLINTWIPEGEAPFHCPSFSGTATGIIAPKSRWLRVQNVRVGDIIIGATSSEWHCNGASLIISRAMRLKENFLTKLPNGRTLGEQALTVTRSYVPLAEKLFEFFGPDIEIHHIQPITGGGITKLTTYELPFRYRIHTWVEAPPVCEFMRELGVSVEDCYTTFNMGIGLVLIVAPDELERVMFAGRLAEYELVEIGRVEEGNREVIFEPEGGLVLHYPED